VIPIAALSPRFVVDNYLRGINLGSAWSGAEGEAAIMQMLLLEVERAQAIMGIHFIRTRIMTWPESTLVQGTDYDKKGLLVPYTPPQPGQQFYGLTLHYHDVQAITRVRLYEGDISNVHVFETIPNAACTFASYQEQLYVPVESVAAPDAGVGWAIDYLQGLGALPLEVVQWAALGTAIAVLGSAGAGRDVGAGLGSTELSMDGITERIAYGGGRYGSVSGVMYAGPLTVLSNQRDDIDLSRLRFRYQNTIGDCVDIPPDAIVPVQPYEQTVCTPRTPPALTKY